MNETNAFICPRCGAEYATEYALGEHVKSHVTGAPTAEYTCLECGASYETADQLEEHRSVHQDAQVNPESANRAA